MIKNLLILFVLSIFVSCTSSENENKDLLYIDYIHSDFFSDYYLIIGHVNSKSIYIISEKKLIDSCKENVEYKIKERSFYKLELKKVKTPIESDIGINGRTDVIYIDSVKIWQNGKIIGPVFSSPNLRGVCITNPNIFHYP